MIRPYEVIDLIAARKGMDKISHYEGRYNCSPGQFMCYDGSKGDSSTLKDTRGYYIMKAERAIIQEHMLRIINRAKELMDEDIKRIGSEVENHLRKKGQP